MCVIFGLIFVTGPAQGQADAQRPETSFDVTLREFGAEELAYLCLPKVRPSLGVLMVVGPSGLDQKVRQLATDLSQRGMIVLVLDFYGGRISKTAEEQRQAQLGVSERYCSSIVQAGMRLFAESPRYQMKKVVVAVWGENLNLVLNGLRRAHGLDRLVGLAALEPAGSFEPSLWERYRVPGLFVVREDVDGDSPPPWRQSLRTLQAKQGASLRVMEFRASAGFLLDASSDEMARAWTEITGQWLRWVGEAETATPKSWLGRVWDTITP